MTETNPEPLTVDSELPNTRLTSVPASDWIEHRRADGVRVGWMVPDGEGFHTVDLLGRRRTTKPVEWLEAEETLDDLGIGYLANRYGLVLANGEERRVRIGEATPSRVVVFADDFGDALVIGSNPEAFTLPFPAPASLRSLD